jgi:hypothetical protein
VVPDTREDALERPTIELLVVDDENVELAQKRSLPSGAKGGTRV